ncbi:uncharacterized protein LOC112590113 [Harpegnathos saltator]|uniref:uncharacterized protein LOC112590113 n=1 Tax=Harpegnathos saltator TaxID=610380 RepID=UPI000DBEDE8D|nr:uncharacterized protein LOC112590113 [Harpegnathos saltator]
MKPYLKLSTSRKPLHKLSMRRRNMIMRELRRNFQLQNSEGKSTYNVTNVESNDNSVLQNVSALSQCTYFNNLPSVNENIASTSSANVKDDRASYSSSISSDSSCVLSSCFSSLSEPSFTENLASLFVDCNLTHSQGNRILSVLRTHICLSHLPKDVRTLLNTPRHRVVVCTVEPGKYIHFNVEVAIVEYLSNVQCASDIRELELDFSTDRCTLDRSGTIQIWQIQCRISNLQNSKPIVVGIYKGAQKPNDANAFFEKFIIDITAICNEGVNFHGALIPVRLRAFIADAPARAFLLHHRGHTSYHPCSKCKVNGMPIDGRNVFHGVKHLLRTDEDYRLRRDENHHKKGTSPLPMGMVSQVPFEYMHLVCLGVVKKLLSAWVYGKYLRMLKL